MKRIGVVLSGCGVFDGAEIHESVLTLLALDRAGVEAICLAPDVAQRKVTDHLTGQDVDGPPRRVLVESARIARGDVRPIGPDTAAGLDAVIIPGGYGAALNLSDFGVRGAECEVEPATADLLRGMLEQRKPIGALCIAPGTLARVLQQAGIQARLTIGNDRETASAIEAMGHRHVDCRVDEVVVDEDHKIVSSPAYMLGRRIGDVATGIDRLVAEVVRRA